MKREKLLIVIIFFGFLASCNDNRFDQDVTNINIEEVTINRLEQDVFGMQNSKIEESTIEIINKYGDFYKGYIAGVINNGGISDSSYAYRMQQFINDRDMREAYDQTQILYPTLDFLEHDLTNAFKHFHYYFPERKLPNVVTMMSGFNYPIVYFENTIGIGLDMYLGGENKFYTMLALPKYRSKYMNKSTIVPDALRNWMLSEFPYNMEKSDFLSDMVYTGKIIFLTDILIPDVPDSLKIQYSQQQLEYCEQNEFNIWTYFVAQKTLYTTNQAEIIKYTSEGPFTAAFSKAAPPRIAYWIGWQIVKQYMENNPEITVEQLMEMKDAQQLLAKSKYKPKK